MVFRANLPSIVQKEAVKCGEIIGSGSEAWVLALDAMPRIGDEMMLGEKELKGHFDALERPFSVIRKVKQDPFKKTGFTQYTKKIEEAYNKYMSTEAYAEIKGIIEESLKRKKDSVVFHEGNACPEFWEQTRIVGGINLAESLLRCAQSLQEP
jgi:hypothetical protein